MAGRGVEARYGTLHNLSMAVVSAGMIGVAILHFASNPANAPNLSLNDPRFVLFAMLALAMGYYVFLGISRYLNRQAQVVIDRDGIDLRLSMWNFDDGLRPIRGLPSAVLVRDNGLDTSASAMLDAVKSFRPNLVKP